MKRSLFLPSLLLVFAGSAGLVDAFTISGIDGTWLGTTRGTDVRLIDGVSVSYGNGLEDQIRWGVPSVISGNGEQSGLGFTGNAAPPELAVDEVFEIGQLRHFNNTQQLMTSARAAELRVALTFADPSGVTTLFDFSLRVRETLNDAGPPASDDIIEFPSAFSTGSFRLGGIPHTLELLGFGAGPDALVDRFSSPEGQSNATRLWGRITRHPASVPDGGATLVLLGLAAGVLLRFGAMVRSAR